jgi:hypothetical protein
MHKSKVNQEKVTTVWNEESLTSLNSHEISRDVDENAIRAVERETNIWKTLKNEC